MKLTKLSAQNIKGESFELDLTDLTQLVGENFRGKTARLDAIRLLLIGYIPKLGKKPGATFELCSGRELVVSGTFSDGSTAFRRWYLNKNSVKTEARLPAWLAEANGDLLAVMLDRSTYFELGATDQVRYVFDHVALKTRNPEQILANLRGALADIDKSEWPDLPPDKPGERFDAVEAFLADLEARRRLDSTGFAKEPQTFLAWLIGTTGEIEADQKRIAGTMGGTVQGLAHLRAADPAQADLSALDLRRNAMNKELQDLYNERAKANERVNRGRAQQNRRRQIQLELDKHDEVLAKEERAHNELDSLQYEFQQFEAGRDDADADKVARESGEVSAALRTAERDLREVVQGIERNRRELAEIGSKPSCPYCGATGTGWRALKTAEIESALAGLRTKQAQLTAHIKTLSDHQAQLSRRSAEILSTRNAGAVIQQKIAAATQVLAACSKAIAGYKLLSAELALIEHDDEAAAAEAFNALETKVHAKTEELRAIDEARRNAMARQNDVKRLAEAEQARDRARVGELVAKAAGAALKGMQADLVAEAFGPLLATANQLCGSVLRAPLAYRDGELGLWRDGSWVSHRVFSGTEEALAYVAIQMALAAASPARIFLLDECGVIHSNILPKVQYAIAHAISAGRLDQYVGIDTERTELHFATLEGIAAQSGLTAKLIEV